MVGFPRPLQVVALVLLPAATSASFIPFAGVEELAPRPFHEFCGEHVHEGDEKLRRCSHSVKRTLDDNGEVELEWEMEVDPDRILSLDTEAARGVRLTKCSPNEIEVEMPEDHITTHANEGDYVVGSRFVHGCRHLSDKSLYHRIDKVQSVETKATADGKQRLRRLTLATTELPSMAHVLPYVSFHFRYMPVEARDLQEFPEMRTDFGQKGFPASQAANARKLDSVDSDMDFGGVHSGSGSSLSSHGEGWLHSLRPKQISNFGWNWDFFMNCTEEPEFNYTAPGFDGFMKLKQPFIKIHAGVFLNFTSRLGSLLSTPEVQWAHGFDGHGQVSARIQIELETTGEAAQDPFQLLNMPILSKLSQPMWFQKMDLAVGAMPMSVEPGFQMKGELYHKGVFNGTLQAGGKAHVQMQPRIEYKSDAGLETQFEVAMQDVDLWPPLWLIETNNFEMGLVLQPQMFLRGQVTSAENDMLDFEARPYLNISLNREGLEDNVESVNTLVVYPVRVMGLENNVDKEYKVVVDCTPFGHPQVSTSPEPNWGQLMFTDPVRQFECGKVQKMSVITTPISVSLIELDVTVDPPHETQLGHTQVSCGSFVRGVCQQTPQIAQFTSNGKQVSLQLSIVWEDDYVSWFAEQLKNIAVSVDSVVLRAEAATMVGSNASGDDMQLRISHGGHVNVIQLSGPQSDLKGNHVLEFGTSFLSTWESCEDVVECQPGVVELYHKGSLLCKGTLPAMPEKHISTKLLNQVATIGGHNVMGIPEKEPIEFAMFGTNTAEGPLAISNLFAVVASPSQASMFLNPFGPAFMSPSSSVDLKWTVALADPTAAYTFLLSAMKLLPPRKTINVAYPTVNGRMLEPVGNAETITAHCQYLDAATVDSAEQPCSFSRTAFSLSAYSLGDSVVVMIQWSAPDGTHVMYSPPIFISSAPGVSNPSAQSTQAPTGARRLWTALDWNKRLAQSTMESCEDKDLNFAVGAGLLIGGKIVEAGGSPNAILGQDAPVLSTGLREVFALRPEAKAKDMLPSALCSDGVCSGKLPTCTKANYEKKHFPRLDFNMNRKFLFNKTRDDTIETMLAYAFSVLPEAVEVIIMRNGTELPWGSTSTTVPPLVIGQTFATTTVAPAPIQWQAVTNSPTPYAGRRLEGHTRKVLAGQQVRLTFKHGLPYRVDRSLVEMMHRHGMFAEMQDDLHSTEGPLFVQDFDVDEGETHIVPTGRYFESLRRNQAVSLVALFGALGAALLLVSFVLRRKYDSMAAGARFTKFGLEHENEAVE